MGGGREEQYYIYIYSMSKNHSFKLSNSMIEYDIVNSVYIQT
jgi:hypothetical protein